MSGELTGGSTGGLTGGLTGALAGGSVTEAAPTRTSVRMASCAAPVPMGASVTASTSRMTVTGAGVMMPLTTATTLDRSGMVWTTARLVTRSTAPTYARLEQDPQMTSVPIVPSATTACHGLAGIPRPTVGGMGAPITAGSGSRTGNV